MSRSSRQMSIRMDKHILSWEFAAVFVILVIGSGLHFAFELSNFCLWGRFKSSIEFLRLFGLKNFPPSYWWLQNRH